MGLLLKEGIDINLIKSAFLAFSLIGILIVLINIFPILKKKTRVVYGTRVKKNKRYNSKNFISLSRIFFNHVLTIFSNILNNH